MEKKLNICLSGYGNMGKTLEKLAGMHNVSVKEILTSKNNRSGAGIRKLNNREIDVIIDFTNPDAVPDNIRAACDVKIPIVVGTTGWYMHLEKIKKSVEEAGIGLFYASNFSVGMNVLFRIVKEAVKSFNPFPEYDMYLNEIHHRKKKDSPSGTAVALGNLILKESDKKNEVAYDRVEGEISSGTLHISSTRSGWVIGTHTVGFDSEADNIEIVHRAKNRSGFAKGAFFAAVWIIGKKGIYTMEDLI